MDLVIRFNYVAGQKHVINVEQVFMKEPVGYRHTEGENRKWVLGVGEPVVLKKPRPPSASPRSKCAF